MLIYSKIEELEIPIGGIAIKGDLMIPEKSDLLVIFCHEYGNSRFNIRNRFLAKNLHENGIGTLLLDLLKESEDGILENRFDIDLMNHRLISVTEWIRNRAEISSSAIAYFGSGTGAATALRAAAQLNGGISAIIARSARPDLVKSFLPKVTAPTLFLLEATDLPLLELNKQAFDFLQCKKEMIILNELKPYEDNGKIQEVAEYGIKWLKKNYKKSLTAHFNSDYGKL